MPPKKPVHENALKNHFSTVAINVLPLVQKALSGLEWGPNSKEVKNFILIQEKIRKAAGGSSKPAKEFSIASVKDLIAQRNDAAKAAQAICKSAASDSKGETDSMEDLAALSKSIKDIFDCTHTHSNPLDRAEFFPFCAERAVDMEASPEDCVDLTLCLDHFVTALPAGEKKFASAEGETKLQAFCEELYHCMHERVHHHKDWLTKAMTHCEQAFDRLLKASAAWEKDLKEKLTKEYKFEKLIQKIYSAQKELEVCEIKAKLGQAKHRGKMQKDDEEEIKKAKKSIDSLAEDLYKDQKEFCTIEAAKWILQRNYIPEIFAELQPNFIQYIVPLAQTVDCTVSGISEYGAIIVDRTLQQYSDLRNMTGSLIGAKFNGKTCILKRYCIGRRAGIKAVGKHLAMAKKFEPHVSEENISAIFIENGNLYIQIDQAQDDFSTFIQDKEFNDSAYNPILLIRNMCYVVMALHKEGVLVGDVRPTGWYVSNNGCPKLHGYDFTRVLKQIRKTRESLIAPFDLGKFDAPEVKNAKGDSSALSEASDVYGLGMSIMAVNTLAKESLEVIAVSRDIEVLVDKMTNDNADKRPTALQAFQMTDVLLGKLKNENKSLEDQTEAIKKMSKALSKARIDLEHASTLAEDDLAELTARHKELDRLQQSVTSKQEKMASHAGGLEHRAKLEESIQPPDYWKVKDVNQPWEMNPIPKNSQLFQIFRHVMITDDPKALNKGRDVIEKGDYTYLDLVAVWRMENPLLWQGYAVERKNMREAFARRGIDVPKFEERLKLKQAIAHFPGANGLYKDINETYLIHGTGPDVILSIATGGVNERFTNAAMFGKGSYFAEDVAKNDQYCRGDAVLGAHPELHRRLFPTGGEYEFPVYPYKGYYIILCRILMGYTVRVKCINAKRKEMYNMDFPEATIFATSDERELAAIPGIDNPPLFYSSLVAERGGAIARFREVCMFHSARVYPEYLMCYSRK